MKKIYKFLALFFALTLLSLTGCSSDEDDKHSATGLNSVGSLSDADVKACFDAVNNFRTGSSCFTVFGQVGATGGNIGENIAAGYRTGSDVFTGWKEDNENFSGQGHRRNMLGKGFTKIGIAYFDKKGSTYGRYWVMELSN